MARIALDASGGDNAPEAPVRGALEALEVLPDSCEIVLVGSRSEIGSEIARHGTPPARISIVDAPEKIGMEEKPLSAIRSAPHIGISANIPRQNIIWNERDNYASCT